jgi:hypothetical protein
MMNDRVLGILMCPVFNDELLHNLTGDAEIDDIVVLTNQHTKDLCNRLDASGLTYRPIRESDFDPEGFRGTVRGFTVLIRTNSIGLHGDPSALKCMIEKQIEEMQPCIDVLGAYYCQCGNDSWDVSEWCRSMGYRPAFTYRGDDGYVCQDCVGVAFGSNGRYMDIRARYGNVFYFIPAIANRLEDFASSGAMGFTLENISEDLREQFGIRADLDIIRWLVRKGGIEYSLKVDTGLTDSAEYDRMFLKRSEELGLNPIRLDEGLVTLDAVDSLYENCKRALRTGLDS